MVMIKVDIYSSVGLYWDTEDYMERKYTFIVEHYTL